MTLEPTDYEALARRYAIHRHVNPEVLERLVRGLDASARVLELGCGTGNYLTAIEARLGCACAGVDPSSAMLDEVRSRGTSALLIEGQAESLHVPADSFDFVFSVDVVHHITDRMAAFFEARRVLRPGGRICTVTDSEWIIRHREPQSVYFPETVEIELARYPRIDTLRSEMQHAGLGSIREELAEFSYALTDASPYRDKVFSSLHYLDGPLFQRGLARMEAALEAGPIAACSRYTMLWGAKPG